MADDDGRTGQVQRNRTVTAAKAAKADIEVSKGSVKVFGTLCEGNAKIS
jgi:hypothetical protein